MTAEPQTRARTPAIVLTGFLGAGKTTLLRGILAAEAFGRSAVLVNEFGEVGIDQHLVNAVSPDIVLLDSGCICCQIRGELKAAVLDLLDRRAAGTVPPFERIIIETTGLAEPAPIVSTLHADPVLGNQMVVDRIVTVVDAVAGEATAAHRAEWLQQVAAADLIVLAKTDLVADAGAAFRARLERLVPAAEVLIRAEDDPAPVALLAPSVGSARGPDAPAPSGDPEAAVLGPAPLPPPGASAPARDTGVHSHRHDGRVTSTVIALDSGLDWVAFGVWLSALLHAHGARILRVKGLIDVGEDRPVLLNAVQHMVYPPRHLDGWPPGAPRSRLVFILDGIAPETLHRSFAHHVLAGQRLPQAS